jgi:hypothetical protein
VPWERKSHAQLEEEKLEAEGLGPRTRQEKKAFDNATKVLALQERLRDRVQPFELHKKTASSSKGGSGGGVRGGGGGKGQKSLDNQKKKAQQAQRNKKRRGGGEEMLDINMFTESLKLRKLPVTITTPIRWKLPRGFWVRNLDMGYYVPLCLHGIREQGDFLGVYFGEIAFEMARDLIIVAGPRGRLFQHVPSFAAPLREALMAAANPAVTLTLEASFDIARRALVLLRMLFNADNPKKEEEGGGDGSNAGVAPLYVRPKKSLHLVHHDHFGSDCTAWSGVLCVLFVFIAW